MYSWCGSVNKRRGNKCKTKENVWLLSIYKQFKGFVFRPQVIFVFLCLFLWFFLAKYKTHPGMFYRRVRITALLFQELAVV